MNEEKTGKCFQPVEHIWSLVTQIFHNGIQWDDAEVRCFLDQHTELDFYSASSLKQQYADRHVVSLGRIILIQSQPVFALSP